MMPGIRILSAALLAVCGITSVFAQDAEEGAAPGSTEVSEPPRSSLTDRRSRTGYTDREPPFGGPTWPEGDLEESDREMVPAFRFPSMDRALQPWIDWKTKQNQENGLQFSAHYSTLFQGLSDSLEGTDDKASGGVLRGTIKWTAFGNGEPDYGALLITLDHRHTFRDLGPADIAGSAGYAGITGLFYNDIGFAVINLNWQQALNNGRTGLIVGRYDPNDYQNVLGYVNPWTIFSNLAINLDTSVALPDSSWGVGAGHWLTNQWYVLGGVNDANGAGSDNLEFFEGGAEFYKFLHVGWSPSKGERYLKNVHVLTWHVDEREDAGVPSSHGITFAANWTFDERWMPFARLGFSRGAAPIYNQSATVGLIRKFMHRSDLFGLAVNYGDLPDDSLGSQTTIESFWRFQFSQSLAITPSLQLLLDPALNTETDSVWVFGLRLRLSF